MPADKKTAAQTILLTGATGFVGRALWPQLVLRGHRVRCLTRDRTRAANALPDRDPADWIEGDVSDESAMARALAGCSAMYYLVHEMQGHADFRRRERRDAEVVAQAAAAAGLARIVYLGGVAPRGRASEHLRSRIEVGEILRRGRVPTLELRASMIIGHGSLSWRIVRDLAARLPVMVLPAWLRSRTEPVAIDDVVAALCGALELPLRESRCFDIPGPEVLSGKQILERAAAALGRQRPRTLSIPLLTPRLSSLWVRLVTRASWSVARELVVGLTQDLLASDDRYWQLIGHPHRASFAAAARQALSQERREGDIPGVWGAEERLLGLVLGAG
jgi:uncharacterized protein YbjT (DUF2867 family)